MACFPGWNISYIDRTQDVEEWTVGDEARFFDQTHQTLLDHGLQDPIFSVHLLKTTMAVENELLHASPSCRKVLLSALNPFLNSPIKTKHSRRLARQALALVSRDF